MLKRELLSELDGLVSEERNPRTMDIDLLDSLAVASGTPKVGGHSEASRTPSRPLVPAPM